MSRLSTIFWSVILAGSLGAVALGFAGGRSIGYAAVKLHRRPSGVPAPAVARRFVRQLRGAHSLDAAERIGDAYDRADDPVAERPDGWAMRGFDPFRERARVALVVVDAATAGAPLDAFLDSPIPFTLVVAPDRNDGLLHDALQAHKDVLVDANAGPSDAVARALANGAIGAFGSFDSPAAARRVVALLASHGMVLDAVLDDDAFYRAARAAHVPALTRDVIVDARDEPPLLDAMFGAALARAQRTGTAIVALHARPRTLAAAERFAQRAARDGVDLVPLETLAAS